MIFTAIASIVQSITNANQAMNQSLETANQRAENEEFITLLQERTAAQTSENAEALTALQQRTATQTSENTEALTALRERYGSESQMPQGAPNPLSLTI
ncbi:MAG: hypothetical protein V7776_23100 [Halopseudomonas aestusnigri]